MRRYMAGLVGMIVMIGVMASPTQAQEEAKPIPVVASFSVLADMIEQIGGDHVEVTSLVGPDSDSHAYSPSPRDARRIKQAQLVVFNGLQLEGWMARLLEAGDYGGVKVIASQGVATREDIEVEQEGHAAHAHDDHHHGDADPHAWLDAQRGKQYVINIRDGLIEADPAHAADYRKQADAYLAELETLDQEIHRLIETIPENQRLVVTNHDAFGYFGDAYGIRFLSPLGINTAAAPSARVMAQLIDTLREQGVKALFHENITNPSLIDQLAEESGLPIAGTLYSGALAREGEASHYSGMLRHNTRVIHEALGNTE
ncbi:metal ABC transporter substrate-binding protein [Pistricoccus aurantiacus]|uniref:Metal ABC transporter substrate-binding protein n=1 Tax=Pistricoccus aurantiacus TaxID=1883414 RepID=A0A5B8SPA4_9GAMM|nr:zinc ABC transporter substrate-binding protein [Pistricoccus aurantiacus]QEA38141.1 metal ABC transporter substrate-binding protein [Pistricoccus aurantiacus]